MDRRPTERLLRTMLKKAGFDQEEKLVAALLEAKVTDEMVWSSFGLVLMDRIGDSPWPMPRIMGGHEIWRSLFERAYTELANGGFPCVIDAQHAAHWCARTAAEKAAELWINEFVHTDALFVQVGVEMAAKRAAFLRAARFVQMMAIQGASLPEDEQQGVSDWVEMLTAEAFRALKDAMREVDESQRT